ncbi:DUF2968 domain-containing protein [Burkholderia ambifaria]|uniref:DUF2968 domain-containing protein n=1 Tax=Burkholderia ambifaria TaxID=152480 RepID=UPI0013FDC9D1|nr:DUF2968 domain-containing protein [Burkholderia ambifaria]
MARAAPSCSTARRCSTHSCARHAKRACSRRSHRVAGRPHPVNSRCGRFVLNDNRDSRFVRRSLTLVLMFDQREMTYYVALFQDKHLWRVIKSQEKSRAERVYAKLVQQTVQLADVEIRRTELQAQKTFLERVIALQANRAQQLQADLSVARSQQAEVAQRQQSAREQTQALQVEKRAAQVQLRDLQEQVRQLQRQADTGLPARK